MNANLQGKASIAIKIALLLCLAVIIAVWRSARGTKEESTLFAGDAAQKAMAETVRMMGSKPRLFSIDIQPTEMIVLVRSADAPNHVDQYRYRTATSYRDWRQLFSRAGVTGPEPTRPVMINPNLEENLFDLAEINLAAVAEASREAARRVALEGGGEVSSIRIQRSVSIVPAPHNGAVEWDITVRGPRESASATADAQGKIRRLDISRTRRAQMLDLTEGGAPLTEAIAEIREHFGAGTVFVSFEVSKSTVSFKIRDSKNPDASLGYYWEINGIYESKALLPLEIRRKMGEVVREDQLFAIDDVDWSRLPELRKIALREAAALEGSITRITRIAVERPSTEAGAKPARWKFNLAAALFEENSTVEFDAKSGELIRLNRPKSLQAAVNYLDPEGSRAAIKAIGQELSRATGFVKILLYQAQASITAVTTEQPDVPREFIYSDRDGIRPFGFANAPNPFHRDFTKDWLFTISELEPVFPLLAELQRKTLDRLRLSDGAVDRITFYRHSVFYPRNRKLLVEVWVENPRRENGRVIYDLQGNVLDVVGGRPVGPVTGKEPAGAANLRPVGITDATPARVAQFDALLASYVALAQKYNDTEWGKLRISDPDNFPNLPQAAFREWRKAQRELLECIKGILKVYAERTPPSDAIASPKAAPYASTRVFWETQHELWHHAQLHSALLDKHWREFKTHGFPEDEARLSPWQKELNAVQVKIDAAEERIKGLSPPAGTN